MLYLGVDLGGTNIKAALVNSEGEILCEANTPTNLPRPAEAVCDDIAALCLQLAEGKDVAGVGVGCPGTVDGGTVLYSNNLDWHDFAMEEYLAQKTGLPVAVGNDANVAALGEALAGCAKGAQSTVVVTLGTGVGAGVVLDGKLLTGYTGAASEAGHMVILDTADAPRCTCDAKKDAKGVKKLGIAEARHDAIIEALENAVTFSDAKESISWDEFIDLDVLGNKKRRLQVYDAFHLGYGNAKALFKRLNMMGITKEEVLKALKSQ